jgi:hypothetical protein
LQARQEPNTKELLALSARVEVNGSANTLAYYDTAAITTVKSLIVKAHVVEGIYFLQVLQV